MVSRAISSSIWHTYFEKDPFSRTEGERFRRECLAYGGGMPSKLLVEKFVKQEVTPTFLSQSLIDEIGRNNEKIDKLSKEIGLQDKTITNDL